MESFIRVLSGHNRFKAERRKDLEELNGNFAQSTEALRNMIESKNAELYGLIDLIYESSFPEEQLFMKAPNQTRSKSNEQLILRLLSGLQSVGVEVAGQLADFVSKHGMDAIIDPVVSLLELLVPMLDSKAAPDFTSDDVLKVLDYEWSASSASPRPAASPLLNIFALASSPRLSSASAIASPRIGSASPSFKRAFTDRAFHFKSSSAAKEVGYSNPLDKMDSQPAATLTTSASSKHPQTTNSSAVSGQSLEEVKAYSLNLGKTTPKASEKRHRGKSSSLGELFTHGPAGSFQQSVTTSPAGSKSGARMSADFSQLIPFSSGEQQASTSGSPTRCKPRFRTSSDFKSSPSTKSGKVARHFSGSKGSIDATNKRKESNGKKIAEMEETSVARGTRFSTLNKVTPWEDSGGTKVKGQYLADLHSTKQDNYISSPNSSRKPGETDVASEFSMYSKGSPNAKRMMAHDGNYIQYQENDGNSSDVLCSQIGQISHVNETGGGHDIKDRTDVCKMDTVIHSPDKDKTPTYMDRSHKYEVNNQLHQQAMSLSSSQAYGSNMQHTNKVFSEATDLAEVPCSQAASESINEHALEAIQCVDHNPNVVIPRTQMLTDSPSQQVLNASNNLRAVESVRSQASKQILDYVSDTIRSGNQTPDGTISSSRGNQFRFGNDGDVAPLGFQMEKEKESRQNIHTTKLDNQKRSENLDIQHVLEVNGDVYLDATQSKRGQLNTKQDEKGSTHGIAESQSSFMTLGCEEGSNNASTCSQHAIERVEEKEYKSYDTQTVTLQNHDLSGTSEKRHDLKDNSDYFVSNIRQTLEDNTGIESEICMGNETSRQTKAASMELSLTSGFSEPDESTVFLSGSGFDGLLAEIDDGDRAIGTTDPIPSTQNGAVVATQSKQLMMKNEMDDFSKRLTDHKDANAKDKLGIAQGSPHKVSSTVGTETDLDPTNAESMDSLKAEKSGFQNEVTGSKSDEQRDQCCEAKGSKLLTTDNLVNSMEPMKDERQIVSRGYNCVVVEIQELDYVKAEDPIKLETVGSSFDASKENLIKGKVSINNTQSEDSNKVGCMNDTNVRETEKLLDIDTEDDTNGVKAEVLDIVESGDDSEVVQVHDYTGSKYQRDGCMDETNCQGVKDSDTKHADEVRTGVAIDAFIEDSLRSEMESVMKINTRKLQIDNAEIKKISSVGGIRLGILNVNRTDAEINSEMKKLVNKKLQYEKADTKKINSNGGTRLNADIISINTEVVKLEVDDTVKKDANDRDVCAASGVNLSNDVIDICDATHFTGPQASKLLIQSSSRTISSLDAGANLETKQEAVIGITDNHHIVGVQTDNESQDIPDQPAVDQMSVSSPGNFCPDNCVYSPLVAERGVNGSKENIVPSAIPGKSLQCLTSTEPARGASSTEIFSLKDGILTDHANDGIEEYPYQITSLESLQQYKHLPCTQEGNESKDDSMNTAYSTLISSPQIATFAVHSNVSMQASLLSVIDGFNIVSQAQTKVLCCPNSQMLVDATQSNAMPMQRIDAVHSNWSLGQVPSDVQHKQAQNGTADFRLPDHAKPITITEGIHEELRIHDSVKDTSHGDTNYIDPGTNQAVKKDQPLSSPSASNDHSTDRIFSPSLSALLMRDQPPSSSGTQQILRATDHRPNTTGGEEAHTRNVQQKRGIRVSTEDRSGLLGRLKERLCCASQVGAHTLK